MCQVLKMSTLSDHAFPMHLRLYPPNCITQPVLLLTGSRCNASARAGQGCAFLQTQIFKSSGVELGQSTELGGNTGLCSGSGKKAITEYCLCGSPDPPGRGLTQWVSLHEAGRQFLSPWVSSLGKSLELRLAVFQHAVSDVARMKMGFIVTFFIKSINSPSNNLNVFS